jgi:uncharacterized protein DUF4388
MLSANFWDQVPTLNTKIDFTNLPVALDESDVFVLSRVNGMLSLGDIAAATRLERLALERIIGKLAKSDLILFPNPHAKKELLDEVYGSGKKEEFPGEHEIEQVKHETGELPRAKRPVAPVENPENVEAGKWDRRNLFTILTNLFTNQRTGVLRLMRDKDSFKALFFDHGELVNAATVPFKAGETLGRVVQRAGLVEQHHVIESLRRAKQSGRLQGEELVELGVIKQDRLDEMLKVHLEVKLSEVVDWGEGTYTFQPLAELPGKIVHVALDFPRLLFNLIWKRYPVDEIKVELDERIEKFVGTAERPLFEVADFGFGEGLEKFCKIVDERDSQVKRLLVVTNLKGDQTFRMIWAMYLLGVNEFFDRSREDRTMARIHELSEEIKVAEKGTLFDVLGVHWTANDERIQEVFRRRKIDQEAAVRNSVGLEQQLNRKLMENIERAFRAQGTGQPASVPLQNLRLGLHRIRQRHPAAEGRELLVHQG